MRERKSEAHVWFLGTWYRMSLEKENCMFDFGILNLRGFLWDIQVESMKQLTYLHGAWRGGRKPMASSFANLLWVRHVLSDDLHLNVAIAFAA